MEGEAARVGIMQIGELARRVGVSTKTIRYYEDIGVLPQPERASNGYRDYGDESVDRLQFIRDAQATGLTLTEISSILDMRQHGAGTCHHVTDLLERHLADLDKHIDELHRTRDQLASMTERAKHLDPADCTDPNRCQTIAAGPDLSPLARHDHTHAGPKPHGRH